MSTLTVDNIWELVKLQLTEISTLTVNRISVALKATSKSCSDKKLKSTPIITVFSSINSLVLSHNPVIFRKKVNM